ncbi:MAG: tRNA uridine 5-carboxymethylaminomethyl modification enzyme [Myxococcota bacterium]|jgi:tRNA uridine 5-carboxymethylaminomethyl modification enzyme
MGRQTLLLTMSIDKIGAMSCNPAIGGVGKGHIVREVDALGGIMGRAADATGIQFRRLNTAKGPAVRARRCQSDKTRYANWVRSHLEHTPNLTIKQAMAEQLVLENGVVRGIITRLGIRFEASAVVLTTGTFLGGLMHVGASQQRGGRSGDQASMKLGDALEHLGLETGRLKTGTVPRLDAHSLDLASLQEQPGDEVPMGFSFFGEAPPLPQKVCWITATTEATHDIIRANLHRSPIYGGGIDAKGPRYCPSIEDKVVRFAERQSHRIFLEPEGLDTQEIYPNGISTSLPFDVQYELVRTIPGCERAEITRPGYAVEYTYVDPRQLDRRLAVQSAQGLFLAGQINGTTGYEEAAGQGIVAGINAALSAVESDQDALVLDRSEAYIGVMIDDLVTRGASEPYRMFTSRAEYRLLLREDNADERLCDRGHALGVLSTADHARYLARLATADALQKRLGEVRITPTDSVNATLSELGQPGLTQPCTALSLMERPETDPATLAALCPGLTTEADGPALERVTVRARYAGYIERQTKQVQRHLALEAVRIPNALDFGQIDALSMEVREALGRVRPATVGQAGRVEGVTPAAISVLLVHLKRIAA